MIFVEVRRDSFSWWAPQDALGSDKAKKPVMFGKLNRRVKPTCRAYTSDWGSRVSVGVACTLVHTCCKVHLTGAEIQLCSLTSLWDHEASPDQSRSLCDLQRYHVGSWGLRSLGPCYGTECSSLLPNSSTELLTPMWWYLELRPLGGNYI